MKRALIVMVTVVLLLAPGLAAAQAPAGTQAQPPAQHEPQAQPPTQAQPQPPPPSQPQAQPQPGPGMPCPMMPGQMTPEQMKQMQEKMGQACCAMMQQGKGCPLHQQMQKQLDELRQRVEALEKQVKGKKK